MIRLRPFLFALLPNSRSVIEMVWVLPLILFAVWFIAKVAFGKGGFIHFVLLCAVAVAVVELVALYRAAQRQA
ncbi:MAG: DUF5670 family protein [Acidobacteriota bacterium]|nr:DUF5670 family protein [Acidobacteriota bacterium]